MPFNRNLFESMKRARGLDFLTRNMTVTVDGRPGNVVGAYGANLLVRFDGQKRSRNCHPHWRVTYLSADGGVIRTYAD